MHGICSDSSLFFHCFLVSSTDYEIMVLMSHQHPALISPLVLEWAIARSETNKDDLAKATGTSSAIVEQWIVGSKQPSFRQAKTIAKRVRLPFGYLFLDSPPPDNLPIPDLRTINGESTEELSVDLRDVVLSTLRKQEWLSEHRKELGSQPIAIVGSVRSDSSSSSVATKIRRWLGLLAPSQRGSSPDEFLRELIKVIENGGVSVLRSGIVGNNTTRTLKVEEFRGFAISDKYAPFIFINSVDAKAAQIFTLIHELAHICRGDTGISGGIDADGSIEESFCNKVAADVLVPPTEFAKIWSNYLELEDAIKGSAKHFHASRYVIAIRAFESGYISRQELTQLLVQFSSESSRQRTSKGGDFYKTLVVRNGRTFTQSVVNAVARQQVLVRDAASLLDAKPSQLSRVSKEVGRV